MSYSNIYNFGKCKSNKQVNTIEYCIDNTLGQRFAGGSHLDTISGQEGKQCQHFLGDYCSKQWDTYCDIAFLNTNKQIYPVYAHTVPVHNDLSIGDIHLINAAERKYLYTMSGAVMKQEPFNAHDPTSPNISYWEGHNPTPEYAVDALTIDDDEVMNKILERPYIAYNLLNNIYHTMYKYGMLYSLHDTKLGKYYNEIHFSTKG
jgi:hypothetical protein